MTFCVEPGEARDSSVRREGEADEDGSLISAQTSSVTSSLSRAQFVDTYGGVSLTSSGERQARLSRERSVETSRKVAKLSPKHSSVAQYSGETV